VFLKFPNLDGDIGNCVNGCSEEDLSEAKGPTQEIVIDDNISVNMHREAATSIINTCSFSLEQINSNIVKEWLDKTLNITKHASDTIEISDLGIFYQATQEID
jgi:hypothetical protein